MSNTERKGIKLALAESGEHLKTFNESLDTIEKVNYSSLFSLHFSSIIRLDLIFHQFFVCLVEKRFEEKLLITNQVKVRSISSFDL